MSHPVRRKVPDLDLRQQLSECWEQTDSVLTEVEQLLTDTYLKPGPLASVGFSKRMLQKAREGLDNALTFIPTTEDL